MESYQKKANGMDQEIKQKAIAEARQYNIDLTKSEVQLTDPFKDKKSNGERFFITKS